MSTTSTPRAQQAPFAVVDRAHAEEMEVARIDERVRLLAEQALESRFAAQHRRRHAVHGARGRGRRGVEVGVRVEPQHKQLAARLGRMARDAADRAHRQAVVAADHDRRPPGLQRLVGLAADEARPRGDAGVIARRAAQRRDRRLGRGKREIARILHLVAEAREDARQTGDAQHRRPHRGAGEARPVFDRRPQDRQRAPARRTHALPDLHARRSPRRCPDRAAQCRRAAKRTRSRRREAARARPGPAACEPGADFSASSSLLAWRRLCARGIRTQGRPEGPPPEAVLRILDFEFLSRFAPPSKQ